MAEPSTKPEMKRASTTRRVVHHGHTTLFLADTATEGREVITSGVTVSQRLLPDGKVESVEEYPLLLHCESEERRFNVCRFQNPLRLTPETVTEVVHRKFEEGSLLNRRTTNKYFRAFSQNKRPELAFPVTVGLTNGAVKRTFEGKPEGQNSHFAILVQTGDGFQIAPVANWYNFNPSATSVAADTETAEKQMAKLEQMRERQFVKFVKEEEEPKPEATSAVAAPPPRRAAKSIDEDADVEDEVTAEEEPVFDDDEDEFVEGAGAADENQTEKAAGEAAAGEKKTRNKKLSDYGSEIKKLLEQPDQDEEDGDDLGESSSEDESPKPAEQGTASPEAPTTAATPPAAGAAAAPVAAARPNPAMVAALSAPAPHPKGKGKRPREGEAAPSKRQRTAEPKQPESPATSSFAAAPAGPSPDEVRTRVLAMLKASNEVRLQDLVRDVAQHDTTFQQLKRSASTQTQATAHFKTLTKIVSQVASSMADRKNAGKETAFVLRK